MKKSKGVAWISVFAVLLAVWGSVAVSAEPETGADAAVTAAVSDAAAADLSDSSGLSDYETYIGAQTADAFDGADVAVSVQADLCESGAGAGAEVVVPQDGLYEIGITYLPVAGSIVDFTVSLRIDGATPFTEAEKLTLPRYWQEGEVRKDNLGNEYTPEPVLYGEVVSADFIDISGWSADPYLFYLSAGTHRIELASLAGDFSLLNITLKAPEQTADYEKPQDADYYTGPAITLEGEGASLKNSYWINANSDPAGTDITPSSYSVSALNYIGGTSWSDAGDTIYWETPELEAGYYNIGFSFKQDANVGSSVYRWLKIDGETPFSEAAEIPFAYEYNWTKQYFADKKGNAYWVYLDAGVHTISLTATLGPVGEVADLLTEAVDLIGDLYVDITMVTGQSVDVYRDYSLFEHLPELEGNLRSIMKKLNKSVSLLQKTTNQSTSSQISVIDEMRLVISQILDNKYSAQKYISNYYTNYCSLAATLSDMQSMPLAVDAIYLSGKSTDITASHTGFFERLWFSTCRFFYSFTADYIEQKGDDSRGTLEVWVNWGRDQAQVLCSLIESSFAEEYNAVVNVKIVNASLVQGILSGNGPDVFLQHSRSEPVNLAMRGVLYDLTQFEDIDTVLERFGDGAENPYRYQNGLYALPDTQSFYLMYYRTDVFDKLNLSVPTTWDEFKKVSKELTRNNLYTWLPYTQIGSVTATDSGVGSLSLFPTLMVQNGLSLFSEDQRSSSLTDESTIRIFTDWTNYYTKMRLSVSMNFYNRFRTGTCPLGIDTIATYTTLKAAASEIDGKWNVSVIPGTVGADGTVNRSSTGGGNSCGILKDCDNPDLAWSFLKWWTDADTQLSYSNNVESVLGASARISVSNREAFSRMAWDVDMKEEILSAANQVEEIAEVPGSYYLSRAIDHSFWNVINLNKKPKNMLLKWGKEVDTEIARKWEQYENR